MLVDEGFDIVQPSVTIQERFGLKEVDESPDVDIADRKDLQGIVAQGENEPVKAIKALLQSVFDDVIIRQSTVTINGIYAGLIRKDDATSDMLSVDIGPVTGKLPKELISDRAAEQVVVQVEKLLESFDPLLTRDVSFPGKYAILLSNQGVKVSRKIRDPQKQSQLLQLGKEISTPQWGILWRTASENQPLHALREEAEVLMQQAEAALKRNAPSTAPAVLWEGDHIIVVEFPHLSKKSLDQFRGSVTTTLEGHHYYKACGEAVSAALEMAEKLLDRGHERVEIERLFKQAINLEYPDVGSIVDIDHVKLDGQVIHLGKALIEAFNEDSGDTVLRRNFEREGIYDGLNVKKESGDYAITKFRIGGWNLETQYFARDGTYKGTYVNINTPIELYPYGIRYVDLEVDVCIWPSGEFKTLDEEELEKALLDGTITGKLDRIVKEQLHQIKQNL